MAQINCNMLQQQFIQTSLLLNSQDITDNKLQIKLTQTSSTINLEIRVKLC